MDLFRVAVVQAGSVPFDRERSTMKTLDLMGHALGEAKRDASLTLTISRAAHSDLVFALRLHAARLADRVGVCAFPGRNSMRNGGFDWKSLG